MNYPWIKWAQELQSIAQCGLAYCNDIYDQERYERIREIAAEMVSHQTEIPIDHVKDLFCGETGYQTPKLDTRAAIFKDGKILLVQEKDGLWSLPGGWVDVDQSIRDNTEKEVWEEAGLKVHAKKIIAVQDRNRHNRPFYIHGICKIFVLCEAESGAFKANSETIDSGYFGLDELPPLSEAKTCFEQVAMCFNAVSDPQWEVEFD